MVKISLLTKITIFSYLVMLFTAVGAHAHGVVADGVQVVQKDTIPDILPGTQPLTLDLSPMDRSAKMLNGAHAFIDRKIDESMGARAKMWKLDFRSREAYEKSIDPNRQRFMQCIGVVDKNRPYGLHKLTAMYPAPPVEMQKISVNNDNEVVAETETYRVYQVRWPVLNGVYGEGLLLQPKGKTIANIVALPDADQTPEQLAGLAPGVAPESQFGRRLAENGFQVLIPVLISRSLIVSDKTNQESNREWIYRQAFHMGRHLIGYEVQKVIAAIDWFKQGGDKDLKVGVAGYCEGGLLAYYSAAVDKRIDAVLVSGYFNSRQRAWDEPLYRNVWRQLSEFGDAEVASLIAPRSLVVEYSAVPEGLARSAEGPDPVEAFRYTGYKGQLTTPPYNDVRNEFNRIDEILKKGWQKRYLVDDGKKAIPFGSASALEKFAGSLGVKTSLNLSSVVPVDKRSAFDVNARQMRQVQEIENNVQSLLHDSGNERNNFFLYKVMPAWGDRQWSTKSYHQYFSPDHFIEEGEKYRKYFREEVLGKFDDPYLPPNARTRKIYDNDRWAGYEVVLDVYKDLIAPGVLLVPKDIQRGEKRPVVVVQHGRNGVPQIVIEGNTSYNDIGAKLADQGFIVYAPYGLFTGEDRYRWLDRKANTLGKTLFSFIIAQHEQTLRWLGSLAFVDPARIAFYGKSYGGETAMRVPSVLPGYCLSICSADFGDWTSKVVDTHFFNSYPHTIEWEMPYFNMGSTFSYAEMAYLIFPRPFMVERGHHDLVQPDEWVVGEYAKVKFLYDQFNKGDNTAIQVFNGGHSARNEGTFVFLHEHLDWP
jgi:dienelactone hydrolase